MIKIDRPKKAPDELKSKAIKDTLKSMRAKANKGKSITKEDIPSHWSGARLALFNMHHGKCCYCERRRDKAREPDVEHYRPKGGVIEDKTHPGYWWLAYKWENLLWSCKSCNEDYKRSHFPVDGARVSDEKGILATENPLLLNPSLDNCEQFFVYDWDEAEEMLVKMQVRDDNPRGRETKNILGLNRLELLQERGDYLKLVLKPIAVGLIVAREQAGLLEKKWECISNLKKVISPKSEFSGLARAYFRFSGLTEYF